MLILIVMRWNGLDWVVSKTKDKTRQDKAGVTLVCSSLLLLISGPTQFEVERKEEATAT